MQENMGSGSAQGFLMLMLDEISTSLCKVERWAKYKEIPRDELPTVAKHLLESGWLMAGMCAAERKASQNQLNYPRLALAAIIHDVAEIKLNPDESEGNLRDFPLTSKIIDITKLRGDVTYTEKNDPAKQAEHDARENAIATALFAQFPEEVREVFDDAYKVVKEDSLDGRFFDAFEKIGYMAFAVPQVRNKGRRSLIEVFGRHHEPLLEYAKTFPSVAQYYEPYRDYVAQVLAEEKERKAREKQNQSAA